MYIELINIYLLVGFIFLIGSIIVMIIIEYFSQLQNQVRESFMLPTIQAEYQIVRSILKPIRLAKTFRVPSRFELDQMHPRFMIDLKRDAMYEFTQSLAEYVNVIERKGMEYPCDELRLEIQVLEKEQ